MAKAIRRVRRETSVTPSRSALPPGLRRRALKSLIDGCGLLLPASRQHTAGRQKITGAAPRMLQPGRSGAPQQIGVFQFGDQREQRLRRRQLGIAGHHQSSAIGR
jgi:hypothetical protein